MKMRKKLSPAEITTFCSQTALLLQAGMTPADAMYILLSDTSDNEGRQIYQDVFDVCIKGEPFFTSLESTGVFPSYCIQLIHLGEESGNLDECLQSLADYYEKEDSFHENIKSAVSYPLIMILMMIVVIFVLMTKVLPIFNQVFEELGSDMSSIASTLLTLGQSMHKYGNIFLTLLVLLLLLYFCFTKISFFQKPLTHFINWFPPTRNFADLYAHQRFAAGMAMMLRSGIDTMSSMSMLAELANTERMRKKILLCEESLKKGNSMSEALAQSGIFNNLHSRMVTIGFRSGNIDTVMTKIADSYEKETDRRMQSFVAVLEPTLVIILSVIVGLILLSVILPLMGIMSSIG